MYEVHIERLECPLQRPDMVRVVLQDPVTSRRLPILVGFGEGRAILRGLTRLAVPRPMTHDFMQTLHLCRARGGRTGPLLRSNSVVAACPRWHRPTWWLWYPNKQQRQGLARMH
jgi:Domain of unknown function (DUF151)